MKACHRIRKKLSAYQDGEVGFVQKDAIGTHLHTCEDCRRQYENLLQTHQMLRTLHDIEPDAGLSRRIVDSATRVPEPFWVRILSHASRLVPAPAAMATLAAVGILLGTMVGNFWTEKQFCPTRTSSAFHSDPALTLASVKVFDATPPGSFAEAYLRLITYNPEISLEK